METFIRTPGSQQRRLSTDTHHNITHTEVDWCVFPFKDVMRRMSEDAIKPCQFAQLTIIHSNGGQSGESWHTMARQITRSTLSWTTTSIIIDLHSWEDIELKKLADAQLAYNLNHFTRSPFSDISYQGQEDAVLV